MLIELFFETSFDGGEMLLKISGFRHGWKQNCKTPPNLNNVYHIYKEDFYRLVSTLDHICTLGTENDYDFMSGNLHIKAIGSKQGNIEKGKFISSL